MATIAREIPDNELGKGVFPHYSKAVLWSHRKEKDPRNARYFLKALNPDNLTMGEFRAGAYEDDDAYPIGAISYAVAKDEDEPYVVIWNVGVIKPGKGAGTVLVKFVEKVARAWGVRKLAAHVLDYPDSQSLFKKNGFKYKDHMLWEKEI